MPIDLNACNKICHKCVKRYVKKHNLKKGGKFKIVGCEGIPKGQYIPDHILSSLQESPETAECMINPVLWAKTFLDWHCLDPDGEIWKRKTEEGTLNGLPPYNEERANGKSIFHRPYQEEMIKCTSKRKIFRIGRQCLAESSMVQLETGVVKSIKDILPGDRLLSLNTKNGKQSVDTVLDAWKSGKKAVFKIKTKLGHEITCTNTHPFLSFLSSPGSKVKEWTTIQDGLSVDSKIAISASEKVFGSKPLSKDLPEFLGYLLTSLPIKLSQKNRHVSSECSREFNKLSISLNTKISPYPKGDGFNLITNFNAINPIQDLIFKHELENVSGSDRCIPPVIFSAPQDQVRLFLNRLWAGDGYISTFRKEEGMPARVEIGILQKSRKVLEDVQRLLWRFGVHGIIKPRENGWRYTVSRDLDAINFLKNIGPVFGKEIVCQIAFDYINTNLNKTDRVEKDIIWDDIISIRYVGEEDTYDIEVQNNHNFISNGIYTHNSGKTETLCIMILFNIFTHENFHVEVIAPYQSQVDLIFKRIGELINSNNVFANSVSRNVKSPQYTIELKNGSQIIGFTAGTRSNQKAGASRGQTANMLVFDEADMLSPEDIDAALAVIINYPNATVWMSSTPTGRREKFFESCHNDQYREFHYPSSMNPNWNSSVEEYFRSELTEDGYRHEIEAEFGEQEEGVYQYKYIEAAQADWEYKSMRPNPTWSYMIGVDWNDAKIGTTIAVVGFNPQDSTLYLVDKHIISVANRTQTVSCQKIAEINRVWNASYIYVDQGYGSTQIEILHGWGEKCLRTHGPNHPDARLRNIVKGYDFGSTVEIKDLFTKQKVKKPAKPFLVENSVRRFENFQFKYPESDISFTKQLSSYIVNNLSISGRPTYKSQDKKAGDHFLDAVNLALVAFALEEGTFGNIEYLGQIAISSSFRGSGSSQSVSMSEIAKMHRPKPGRSDAMKGDDSILAKEHGSLPAANIKQNVEAKLWSWDGFSRDEAPPQRFREPENRLLSRNRKRGKPSRTKF